MGAVAILVKWPSSYKLLFPYPKEAYTYNLVSTSRAGSVETFNNADDADGPAAATDANDRPLSIL